MKIAIPLEQKDLDASLSPSFGRAPYLLFYDSDTEEGEFVENSAATTPGGAGIRAAQIITDYDADIVLTPRCGENAAEVLNKADVAIYKSMSGTARENVTAFLAGELALLRDFHSGFHHGR